MPYSGSLSLGGRKKRKVKLRVFMMPKPPYEEAGLRVEKFAFPEQIVGNKKPKAASRNLRFSEDDMLLRSYLVPSGC
jgi:hypothetical protein